MNTERPYFDIQFERATDWFVQNKGSIFAVLVLLFFIALFYYAIFIEPDVKAAKKAAAIAERDAKVVTVSTGKQYYPYQHVQHAYFALNGETTIKDDNYWVGHEQYIFRLEGSLVCVDTYRGMDSCLPYNATETLKTEFMNLCRAVGYASCPTAF